MRTTVLRVAALALLLLLALVAVLVMRTLQRLPDTVVYFVRDQGTTFTLEPVYRRTRVDDRAEVARASLESLVAGPTPDEAQRGLVSEVPRDLTVHDVRMVDRTVEADLSGAFADGGGSASMIGRLNQVFYTLSQPAGVDRVALYMDGRPLTVLGGEGVLVPHPWTRDDRDLPRW